uniref:Copper-binding protein PcoE n=1 Tax=Klebsiella pneumoniae TaxID=573 RepID=A0A6G9HTT3_KLEPN|nr:Copper-binding protein PcoE [Klebsiella pneumoniae]
MNILITTTAFTALFCGAAFAQSSDIAHEAHRFVNNASAVSHVNSSTHENLPDRVNKNNTPSFSEMNEHERAIVAHSFMNNSASYAHQKMIEEHKKMLPVRKHIRRRQESFAGCIRPGAGGLVLSVRCAAGLY